MRIFLFIFVNMVLASDLFAQSGFISEKELDIKVEAITTDGFNKLYMVSNNTLLQFDLENHTQKFFTHSITGRISGIDATDPFRILVFYKDFNQVLFLDKNLAPIVSPIFLNQLGFNHVVSVCQSVNGGFWGFDQSLQQLFYVDKSLNQSKKSSSLYDIIDQKSDLGQVYIAEKNDYIYLSIPEQGIFLFDNYGTYIKMFPVKEISYFQIIDDKIFYSHNNKLMYYNTADFEQGEMELPIKVFDRVLISNKRIVVTTEDKVIIFKTNIF
ncbi:MAG TPA: hypothetical protein P5132_05335 [Bacteroidales bacterium]|nr:hypothetical protein [Bacteroidales bacterium]